MAGGGAATNIHGRFDVTDFKDTFLECPVCVEHFNQTNRRPRLLTSCLHAFCTPCLQALLTKEGGHKITCPLCRQVQAVRGNADTLPIDQVRDKLTEYVQMKSKTIFCTDCPDKNEAESRCQECSSYLCAACRSAHKRHHLTRDHTIITLDESSRYPQANFKRGHFCRYHPAQQVEFYCNTDEQLCCVSCSIIKHKGHEVMKLEHAAEAERAKIENKLERISELTQQALQKDTRQKWTITDITKVSEADINTIYNSLKDAVERERKRLLENFTRRSHQALAAVQTTTEAHEGTKATIEATQRYVRKLKETGDAVAMLQMYPSIMRSMDGITGVKKCQVIDVTNLKFKADTLKESLSEFADKAIAEVERRKRKPYQSNVFESFKFRRTTFGGSKDQ